MLTVQPRYTQTQVTSVNTVRTVTATVGSFAMAIWWVPPVVPQKKRRLTHDEMLALARKNPPAQSWFEEDFSTLGRPKR
jgi:hypothetical protein